MRIVGASLLAIAIAVPAATWRVDVAAQTGAAAEATAGAKEIRDVAEKYRKASLAGDIPAVMALYADNAIEMPPNQPLLKGKADIGAYYRKRMKEAKLTGLTLTHLDTYASGDVGYLVGASTQTAKPAAGGEVKDSGHYTVIMRKMAGVWKVTSAIYNSDRPAKPESSPEKPVETTGVKPKP
jgi:ketosteroid isomerase-like protein